MGLHRHGDSSTISRLTSPFVFCLVLLPTLSGRTEDPTPEQIKFFESKIRPVLNEHCLECHGSKKQESDLRLDSREAILKGGATGRIINIEDPQASLILEVLNYGGDVEMPPDQKLDEEVVADILAWIKMGLPWPTPPKTVASGTPEFLSMKKRVKNHRDTHWAFQPLRSSPVPKIDRDTWSANNIDKFILSKLEFRHLEPAQSADRRTLTRRVYLKLLGLPPTYTEIKQVLDDSRADWFPRLVERLLASPRYGERWGRHWLDVARYADTRGYAFARDRNYPHAYTYRDYVISAWNDDKPFDRFVLEQLAADHLELGDDLRPLAGLGFLTVGRKFNNVHDDIDDKIDVVFRGLQGLTVACARCHDHKYDAIPTEDYYSLYGVFASSREGSLPYIGQRQVVEAFKTKKSELDAIQQRLDAFLSQKRQSIVETARSNTALYLASTLGFKDSEIQSQLLPDESPKIRLIPKIVRSWKDYINSQAKDSHPFWFPWKAMSDLDQDNTMQSRVRSLVQLWKQENRQINPLLLKALEDHPPTKRIEIAEIYGKIFSEVYLAWKKSGANDRGLAKLSEAQRQVGIALFTDGTPTEIKTDKIGAYLNAREQQERREIEEKVSATKATVPPDLDRAMVVTDIPQPVEPVVFIRGQAGRPGAKVPRQFIEVLADTQRKPFSTGSGRLDLARQIVRTGNPLTARVIANRVWMRLMGSSIVLTPSDFGTRCPEPVQRDLLDYLAASLIANNWSIKSLQREILTSSTFRQSSKHRPEAARSDTNNELYWRANRQRLEFEPLRDSMLSVSSELDLAMGGKSVPMTRPPYSQRRAVYGFIDRQDLPNLLRAFDFAGPDQSSAKRSQTTVPQQLLFMMNSDFVIQRAEFLAKQIPAGDGLTQRVTNLYRRALSRDPKPQEIQIAIDYLNREFGDKNRFSNLAQILLLTNEFTFVD